MNVRIARDGHLCGFVDVLNGLLTPAQTIGPTHGAVVG
jgi:hypothetical protein